MDIQQLYIAIAVIAVVELAYIAWESPWADRWRGR
jgi:hypothetical protein